MPSISIATACHPSSRHLLILIPIVRSGWRVSSKRSVAFSNLIHIKRLHSANIWLFEKKELLGPFPQCVSLLSRRMRISNPFGQSLASLFLEIMKTECGRRAKGLLRSFDRILSASSLVWLLHLVVPFIRATAKMPSVKGFSLRMRLPSFDRLTANQKPLPMSIGFLNAPSTAYEVAPDTGTIRLAQSSAQLASHPLSKFHASIQVLSVTHWILRQQYPQHRCPLVCMLTTLSISWRMPQLRLSSAVFSLNIAK